MRDHTSVAHELRSMELAYKAAVLILYPPKRGSLVHKFIPPFLRRNRRTADAASPPSHIPGIKPALPRVPAAPPTTPRPHASMPHASMPLPPSTPETSGAGLHPCDPALPKHKDNNNDNNNNDDPTPPTGRRPRRNLADLNSQPSDSSSPSRDATPARDHHPQANGSDPAPWRHTTPTSATPQRPAPDSARFCAASPPPHPLPDPRSQTSDLRSQPPSTAPTPPPPHPSTSTLQPAQQTPAHPRAP
jgi:hypothetical protein